jgi:hypothetical protein
VQVKQYGNSKVSNENISDKLVSKGLLSTSHHGSEDDLKRQKTKGSKKKPKFN